MDGKEMAEDDAQARRPAIVIVYDLLRELGRITKVFCVGSCFLLLPSDILRI